MVQGEYKTTTNTGATADVAEEEELAPNPGQEWEVHGLTAEVTALLNNAQTNNDTSRHERAYWALAFDGDLIADEDNLAGATTDDFVEGEQDAALWGGSGPVFPSGQTANSDYVGEPYHFQDTQWFSTPLNLKDLEAMDVVVGYRHGGPGSYEGGEIDLSFMWTFGLYYLPHSSP